MTDNYTSSYLRDALLREFVSRVEDGETILVGKGEDRHAVTLSAPATTLQAAVAFLIAFPPDDDIPAYELVTHM